MYSSCLRKISLPASPGPRPLVFSDSRDVRDQERAGPDQKGKPPREESDQPGGLQTMGHDCAWDGSIEAGVSISLEKAGVRSNSQHFRVFF